jgi:bifunctional non-homologous end joining protein LigD
MVAWRSDPASVRPMLAALEDPPLQGPGLMFEPKYDGIRALVDLRPPPGRRKGASAHVAIYSRNGNDKTAQFPAVVDALGALARTLDRPLLLDGELVAIGEGARPLGFQYLQGRIHLTSPADIARAEREQPVVLVLFDLLRDGSEDVRGRPLVERRLRLQERVRPRGTQRAHLWLSEVALDDGRQMLARARKEGWEGLIVKDGRSPYSSGRRTPAWRKLKLVHEQELVIGGWTEPRQTRQRFGALLVGYYEGAALRYAGSVGTGFTGDELERVWARLDAIASDRCPFDVRPKTMTRAHWVRPELVVEVRFTEWTAERLLRQPVYLGLREDKSARQVVLEDPAVSGVPGSEGPKIRGSLARPKVRNSSEPPAVRKSTGREGGRPDGLGGRSAARASARTSERTADLRTLGPSDPRTLSLLDALRTLEDARRDGTLLLPNGDSLRVTNLAKLFWPDLKITKGELLRYYVEVAPLILPAVDDRPLVMKRFPNGINDQAFYQQRHPEPVPPGVRREVLPEDVEPADEEGPRDRLIGGSLTTLLYMTQLAAISQDPWFSRVAAPLDQDYAAIDLDPGEGAGFAQVLDVARWAKDELDRLGIPGVPKTSGSRGLHIYIPLPPGTSYDVGQLLCQIVATAIAEAHPRVATVERMVRKRPRGTVYVDYLQNILGKTLATAYSARASDYAGVSTPLEWREVRPGLDPRDFTIRSAPVRFRQAGDRWAALRTGPPVDLEAVLARGRRRSRGKVLSS